MLSVIYRLFFLQRIYFTQTLVAILYLYGLVFALALLGLSNSNNLYSRLIWLWPVAGYLFVRTLLRLAIVRQRIRRRHYLTEPRSSMPSDIAITTLSYELRPVDRALLIDGGENWKVYDATFDFNRPTKFGTYLAKQAFYTVFEFRLNRRVPRIIFDSKTAKRTQFRYLYLQSQRISLEGNFDTFFDSYAPQNYKIDFLSFITPEVMLALIDAHDCDIELIDDRLLLYGPLLSEHDLAALMARGVAIANHLNDNLDNYRDDRLTGLERTQSVSLAGQTLLKSPMKYVPLLVISSVASVLLILFPVTNSFRNAFSQLTEVAFITFIFSLISFMKIIIQNRRLEKQYQLSLPPQPE